MPEPKGLEGKNFRVRQIAIKMLIDVYDASPAAMLEARSWTEELVINEASFPPEIVALLARSTDIGRGFVAATPTPPALNEPAK